TRVSLSLTATFSSRCGKRLILDACRQSLDGAPRRGPARPGARSARAPHERADVGHLAAPHLAHDLSHLRELLDQPVDVLDGRAGALRDPQAPRALDQLRPAALLGGHREDDRLYPVELTFVDLHVLELVAAEPGDHSEQARQGSHLADHPQLLEEVVEPEVVASQLALEGQRILLVELALGLL